jgi:hypothetical protein
MIDIVQQSIFQSIIGILGSLTTAGCALFYFKHVRLERPPIGTFNFRDIGLLLLFILSLPFLFLVLPPLGLTAWLVLAFTGALYFCLRPLMRRRYVWPLIALLLAGNIWVATHLLGTIGGWQIYWICNSIVMLLIAAGVANVYVQGGMRLRHIAWFGIVLGAYDYFTALVYPLSQQLADRFVGRPLDPSIGFRMGLYSTNVGLGDLLVYSCFAIAAYKGFGKRGAIIAFIVIAVFGAIIPGTAPLLFSPVIRDVRHIVVPAQASFGPAAFVTYFLLSRKTKERSMKEWLAQEAAQGFAIRPGSRILRRAAAPKLADVQGAAQGSD